MRAIPSESLGLTLSGHEFVVALRYWLGILLFPASARCSCGTVIDGFGDHVLGCDDGPLRIRRHDAICDVIWHALVQDNSSCKKEQCCGTDLDHPGDVFHPDFQFGRPAYFDVSVHHPLQDSLLCLSAATSGVAAGRGEADKDSHHEASVWAAGGIFVPLVVESLGLWSPNSLAVLRNIALRTISKSGASAALVFCHFIEQLSMHVSVEVQLTDAAPPPQLADWQRPIVGVGWLIPLPIKCVFPGGFCHSEPPGFLFRLSLFKKIITFTSY